jgi:2-polyprenyl-6-methoxyphenol hydroxylase-like FAD-dependent oxidoreductase
VKELTFDACVVGAGPAGAAVSIRLANLGHRVCLIERTANPKLHVGESLTPGTWHSFRALELKEPPAACFVRSSEAYIRWSEPTVERLGPDQIANTALVDRGKFDAFLLKSAQQRGVQIFQPAEITHLSRRLRRWRLKIASNTDPHPFSAKFLVDASGRFGFLRNGRTQTSPRTLAVSGLLPCHSCTRTTSVEALPEGWCWGAPIPEGPYRAILFLDQDSNWPLSRQTLESLWRSTLAKTELFSHVADLPLISTLSCRDATTYFAEDPISEDRIRVGEASFALDPLSSTGVEKAMHSGFVAGTTIHTILEQPERASLCANFYRARQMEAVSLHEGWSRDFYAKVSRYQEYPFWQKRNSPRRQQPTEVVFIPPDQAVSLTYAATVRLSARASVMETPSIVQDEICPRLAVSHPNLGRPVAFVRGVELGPLLEMVPRISTLGTLMSLWSRRVSPDEALHVATWLWERQILEPALASKESQESSNRYSAG